MKKLFLPALLFLLFGTACTVKDKNNPNSTGKGSEILVVCEKAVWDRMAHKTLSALLSKEMEGLPESEPEYTLVNVPYASFSKFLQSHRNVLIIEINPQILSTKVESQTNVWSHPQKVIRMAAPSDSAFLLLLNEKGEAVKEVFNKNERARFGAQNALSRNLKAESTIEKTLRMKMVVSSDFYLAKKVDNLVWLRKETNEMSLGLILFSVPYTDANQLSPEKILKGIREKTKAYIPGSVEGSYMTLSESYLPALSKPVNLNGYYAVETRGLWETHGDFMGGPFINYAAVDTLNARIVNMYGYVYYPNKDKRNYIRQLESIIWGVEFLKPLQDQSAKK